MSMTTEQRKVFEKFTTKPSWMKDAILTRRGWTNPKTGELLLGRRTPDWVFSELERINMTESSNTIEDKIELDVEVSLVVPVEQVPVSIVVEDVKVPDITTIPEEVETISEEKLEAKKPVRRRKKV